jgi:hypothetical protein
MTWCDRRQDFTYVIHRIAFSVQNLHRQRRYTPSHFVSESPKFDRTETESPVRERCLKCESDDTVCVSCIPLERFQAFVLALHTLSPYLGHARAEGPKNSCHR